MHSSEEKLKDRVLIPNDDQSAAVQRPKHSGNRMKAKFRNTIQITNVYDINCI